MKDVYGRGDECILLDSYLSNTTTPVVAVLDITNQDSLALQLIADSTRNLGAGLSLGAGWPTFPIAATDNVVASTKTFVFANGHFTADDVGATITIAGATNGGNNGTFTITSVTNATTVVASGAVGLVNETFNPANVTVVIKQTQLTGTWKIEVSNNYVKGVASSQLVASEYGQVANLGRWTDITTIVPFAGAAPVAVTGTASTQNQFVQYNLGPRAFRVTFTPAAATFGRAIVLIAAKSWSI